MQRLRGPIVLVLSALLAACGGEPLGPIGGLPRQLSVAEQKLITTTNRFAFNLFSEVVRQGHPDSNVFISPLSAAMALGMTYNGARGETRTAMAEVLGLGDLTLQEANESFLSLIDLLRGLDSRVDFRLANSIWSKLGFVARPEFLNVNQQFFDAQVSTLDFSRPEAVNTINGWVNDNTNGRIPKIIEFLSPDIVMLLINTIYFKGTWIYQFDKDRTKDEPFTLRGGAQQTVSMMQHAGGALVGRYRGQGFQVVDLPYGGGAYSMTIVLPDAGRDVDDLATSLTAPAWEQITSGLNRDSVIIAMPKFRLRWDAKLNDVLDSLGMSIAFGGRADLSGIAGAPGDLFISFVKQGTFVEVNEEGTEAAAATVVGIGLVCACGPPVFRIDRPFVVAIRERFSGAILFLGKIMNPILAD